MKRFLFGERYYNRFDLAVCMCAAALLDSSATSLIVTVAVAVPLLLFSAWMELSFEREPVA